MSEHDWSAALDELDRRAEEIDRLRARVAELEAEVETAWERGHDAGHRAALDLDGEA
jgi:hypothetical protein